MLQILSLPLGDASGTLTVVVDSIRQLSFLRAVRDSYGPYTRLRTQVLLQIAGDSVAAQFVFSASRSGVNPCV